MQSRNHILAAATLVLLSACGSDADVTPAGPVDAPVLRKSTSAKAGAASGAIVDPIRGEFTLFADFDRQLIFSSGLVTPIEEACAGAELVTDGKFKDTFIFLPTGIVHGMLTTSAATLVVYGRAPEDPCELTEADVLARGTGRLSFTTNNAFADDSRSTNAGYVVTGIVTLPDGQRAHLLARLRLQIVDGEFRIHTEEFTLRPIGG
jgi:hypothetical protein